MIKKSSAEQLIACEDKIKDLETQLEKTLSKMKELEMLLPKQASQKNKNLNDDEKVK